LNKKALIILAKGFEEIEAITPIDVLRRAGIDVCVAGLHQGDDTVTGSHGITIKTDTTLKNVKAGFDACILPGGAGAEILAQSDLVRSLITVMFHEKKLIAAICAAPAVVLAPTGILDGKRATCFPGMDDLFNDSTIFCKDNVVVDGNIITSRGAGTAMDFSFAIVEKLIGKNAAGQLRAKMIIGDA
jgi:4-methyl-5(b-hydroxyethyl)-thiazole monophosphate biosynthesis